MKTQINNWPKKIIISGGIIFALMIGTFAQKSNTLLCCDSNLQKLKNIVADMKYSEKMIEITIASTENTNNNSVLIIRIPDRNDVAEESLKVEPWMLSESHFLKNNVTNETLETEEESIPVEAWMLDESHFLPDTFTKDNDQVDPEEELKVEDWMLDESHFTTIASDSKSGAGVN